MSFFKKWGAQGTRSMRLHPRIEGLEPRLGAKKGSKQAKATDVITTNKALAASGGTAGAGGSAQRPLHGWYAQPHAA